MSSKAERLGRGASFGSTERVSARRAAIAAVTGAPTEGVEPRHLPLKLISLNPDNPREELRAIEEMAETFQSVGQITAITIGTRDAYLKERPDRADDLEPGTDYVVIDGNRRLCAARFLGWETMPKIVIDDSLVTTDEQLLEAAFIANYQREDFTDLEEAEALRKLVAYYGSQRKAAARLGISQGVISQRLSLLELAPDLQADLAAGRRKVEHVRGLAKLAPEQQRKEADKRASASGRQRRAPAERNSPPAADSISRQEEKPVAVPAQSSGPSEPHLLVRQDGGVQPLLVPEVEWAHGDFSAPLVAARDIAQRFGPTDRRAIISFLLSVSDEEKKLDRARSTD
ncbi:ParB/RepB/Spo0J family partition protein [Actinacidiphila sp. DG2A-62]|uniref:ParB/RepB/Spo0J family partition protein n=1 Tax=Actinacidiphila sp. DG2A-62 TaxID=3108821 RepID=UPI002DC0407B|nr:ParB/RepB/Spo0J family partition protein [Actinacidiphila sp. DG2A-62]MEC3992074.1 ParB/RepB/Spo0J family partition protein [Actinacidiphila sp. DG2A-62]